MFRVLSLAVVGLMVVFSCALYYSGGDGLAPVPASESALVYGGSACLSYQRTGSGCNLIASCPTTCNKYSTGSSLGRIVTCDCTADVNCGQAAELVSCVPSGFAGPQ